MKAEMLLTQIPPTDTPARKAWPRVCRLIPKKLGEPVDLDKLGVIMMKGVAYPALVNDGMHRLARVLDLHGSDTRVVFTLKDYGDGPARLFDDYVMLCARDGVDSIMTFLLLCKTGNFLREDTA